MDFSKATHTRNPEVAKIAWEKRVKNLTQINFNYLNPSNSAVACYPSAFCLFDPYHCVPFHCSCSATILYCSKTLSDDDYLKLYYHESVCCLLGLPACRQWILNHLLGREREKEKWKIKSTANKKFVKWENWISPIMFRGWNLITGRKIELWIILGPLERSKKSLPFARKPFMLTKANLPGRTVTWFNL